MPALIRPQADLYTVPVRRPHPIGQAVAAALGTLTGRGSRGRYGTVRYGEPAPGTRAKYGGYGQPAAMFIGWNPRHVAGGTVQTQGASLPSTSPPAGTFSPLLAAMASVARSQTAVNDLPKRSA